MCFFSKANTGTVTQQTSANEEKKDTANVKARLLATQGGNKGAELQQAQGQSIRRIFG